MWPREDPTKTDMRRLRASTEGRKRAPKAPHSAVPSIGLTSPATERGQPAPPTHDDIREHDEWVSQMHGLGLGPEQMRREGPRRRVGPEGAQVPRPISPEQVERAWFRYCKRLGDVGQLTDVGTRKELAVAQINQQIAFLAALQAELRRDSPTRVAPVSNAMARWQELRARVEGTLAPLEVGVAVAMDVRVQGAVMRVLGGEIDAEHFDRAVDEMDRLDRLLLDVHGEEAPGGGR